MIKQNIYLAIYVVSTVSCSTVMMVFIIGTLISAKVKKYRTGRKLQPKKDLKLIFPYFCRASLETKAAKSVNSCNFK